MKVLGPWGPGQPFRSYSRDGVAWFAWEPFAVTRRVNLAGIPGDGVKTFYVRFKDLAGNVSASYSDTIILDTTLPTGTIAINGGAAGTAVASATLNLSATDANGVVSMQLSRDGVTWQPARAVVGYMTRAVARGDLHRFGSCADHAGRARVQPLRRLAEGPAGPEVAAIISAETISAED